MVALTTRQAEIFQFIRDFMKRHNYPPTVREIAGNFYISTKAAYDHILALKKKNKIKVDGNRQRAIELVSSSDESNLDRFEDIPILGDVAAGKRIYSEENYNGSVRMHTSMLKKNRKYFALKVKGDSMTGMGVMDGDTVIIEKRETAKNGDVVVVDVDDGGRTLKRFFKQSNRIKLQSENPKYPPMYAMEVRILGRLACVYRTYA